MNSVATLWQDHRADLRRFVGRRVSDRHEAEDILQDVFLKAHQSLHQLESTDRAAAWLSRIAANRIIDHYRARRPTEPLPDDLAAAEPEHDPFEELATCLPAMIERLPQTYRVPVVLSEIDGLPQRDVAQRLGLSVSGAKSRVQRGRALLRQLLERCCSVYVTGRAIAGFECKPARSTPASNCGCSGLRPF